MVCGRSGPPTTMTVSALRFRHQSEKISDTVSHTRDLHPVVCRLHHHDALDPTHFDNCHEFFSAGCYRNRGRTRVCNDTVCVLHPGRARTSKENSFGHVLSDYGRVSVEMTSRGSMLAPFIPRRRTTRCRWC